MAGFGLTITGVDRLGATIAYSIAGATPDSRTKLARNLGVLALREHADYFTASKSPSGQPWKAHSPVTTARRRNGKKTGRANQILRDTGALRLSVTPGRMAVNVNAARSRSDASGFNSAATGAVREATPMGFAMGSSLIYARAMQFGMPRRAGHVSQFFREGYRVGTHIRKGTIVASRKSASGKLIKAYHRDGGVVESHRVGAHRVRFHYTTLPAVPARPFVGFSNRYIERATDFIGRWLVQGD